MIEITDNSYQPNIAQISEYIDNPLFDELCEWMVQQYKAKFEIMYSGDNVLLGWNIRFQKSSRTLCRLYPDKKCFKILLVVGRREKERVEECLPHMSSEMQEIYKNTKEGMGQRWLVFPIQSKDAIYEDLLTLISIRKNS